MRRYRFGKIIALVLFVVLSFSGCFSDFDLIYDDYSDSYSYDVSYDYVSAGPSYDVSFEESSSCSSEDPSEYASSANVSSKIEEPQIPKICSLVELRDYFKDNLRNDVLVVQFEWLGEEDLSANEIARMTMTCYVNYRRTGNKYTVTFTEYPGDRIVDAYFSGDRSKLNVGEISALEKAIEIVNEAKAVTSDLIDLEVYLHDYICRAVTYDDNTRSVEDPMNPPRNLTVVGALLDGRANCQGYTDAFYALASIAGFTVDRMFVKTANDLHVLSTIYLGGQWLIVDSTFNDSNYYGNESKDYHLFNASKDVVEQFSWPEHYEMNPIANETSNYFYYNYYDCYYRNAEEFANALLNQYINGKTEIHGALVSSESVYDVSDAFSLAIANANFEQAGYIYFYRHFGNTYYCQFLIS